jgi:hypothetical protein
MDVYLILGSRSDFLYNEVVHISVTALAHVVLSLSASGSKLM